MRAYVHAYEHRFTRNVYERACESTKWVVACAIPFDGAAGINADGVTIAARVAISWSLGTERMSLPARSSAALGHKRLSSRVIVARRRTSSPVAHPVPSCIRQYGRVDDG